MFAFVLLERLCYLLFVLFVWASQLSIREISVTKSLTDCDLTQQMVGGIKTSSPGMMSEHVGRHVPSWT